MATRLDIQEAFNHISNGDTIILPEETIDIDANIRVSNKNFTLTGQGKNKTILKSSMDQYMIRIDSYEDNTFRITDLCMDGSNTSNHIYIKGYGTKNFRIDNNLLTNGVSRSIEMEGYSYGVIDNNEFLNPGLSGIVVYGDDEKGWEKPVVMGGPEYVFVEDNIFTYTGTNDASHCVASNHGSRYVFRHNTINSVYIAGAFHMDGPLDVHGNFYYGRGSVAFEIYDNEIFSEHSYRGMNIRGGSGVIYNNVLTGDFTAPLHLNNYRSWTTPSNETPGGCPVGDDNPQFCPDDYPCIDQIKDLYIWNNTLNGEIFQGKHYDRGHVTSHIQEGRDFFHMEKPNYTPYTYPHPLREGV